MIRLTSYLFIFFAGFFLAQGGRLLLYAQDIPLLSVANLAISAVAIALCVACFSFKLRLHGSRRYYLLIAIIGAMLSIYFPALHLWRHEAGDPIRERLAAAIVFYESSGCNIDHPRMIAESYNISVISRVGNSQRIAVSLGEKYPDSVFVELTSYNVALAAQPASMQRWLFFSLYSGAKIQETAEVNCLY